MHDAGWLLVIERGMGWTAALHAHGRRAATRGDWPQVCRREDPPALATIDPLAAIFVAVEVRGEDVSRALDLLDALRRLPHLGTAGLIQRGENTQQELDDLAQAALEAGACITTASPRAIEPVAAAAVRSLRLAQREIEARLSPSQRAWRRLPWQAEPWPVG